ncbi:glycosyltransferase family A protein [Aeromonas dhakensis]|uniref:glycosyltransferase family A protein n=1 Tax=Aeromonas dhakensis TaxID=196024 RepID=UPI00398821B5
MDKQDYQDIEVIVVDDGSLSLVYSWDAMVHFHIRVFIFTSVSSVGYCSREWACMYSSLQPSHFI